MLSKLVTNLVALLCINGLFYKNVFPQPETSGAHSGELRILIKSGDILGIDNLNDNTAGVCEQTHTGQLARTAGDCVLGHLLFFCWCFFFFSSTAEKWLSFLLIILVWRMHFSWDLRKHSADCRYLVKHPSPGFVCLPLLFLRISSPSFHTRSHTVRWFVTYKFSSWSC